MTLCTGYFSICGLYHKLMKADLRFSVKDYRRNKNLNTQLVRGPFTRDQQV
jgi:hypothetical protein